MEVRKLKTLVDILMNEAYNRGGKNKGVLAENRNRDRTGSQLLRLIMCELI